MKRSDLTEVILPRMEIRLVMVVDDVEEVDRCWSSTGYMSVVKRSKWKR